MATTKKTPKPNRLEEFHQDVRKTIKGKDGKAAVDDFAAAVHALVAAFGKTEAMMLHAKYGMLITLAKEEKK